MENNITRINCNEPRSMYLFFIRLQKILYKNHNGKLSKQLSYELKKLEQKAESYYIYDSYLEQEYLRKLK